jgi:uncharacterized membrane protein HdeD (DUF308 family)
LRAAEDINNPRKWFRIFQVAVGVICISLAGIIIFESLSFRATPVGEYAIVIFALIALMIIGVERIIAGIRSKGLKRSSRIINIAIGAGIVGYLIPGIIYPDFAIKYIVLILGFGLLANGAVRILDGVRNLDYERRMRMLRIGIGSASAIIGIAVLASPKFGFILLLLMVSAALILTGIELIVVGTTGRRIRTIL